MIVIEGEAVNQEGKTLTQYSLWYIFPDEALTLTSISDRVLIFIARPKDY